MAAKMAALPVFLMLLVATGRSLAQGNYMIGRGIADCTGPAAEINMMGYAKGGQDTSGIHLRQFSRAFIVANPDGSTPLVYVSVDMAMLSQLVKHEVIDRLQKLFGDLYTDANVMLSATHTHSGPGAYHQYVLFEVTSLGFYEDSLDAYAEGIVQSIKEAHNNMQPGDIYMTSGILEDSNINRSPHAYNNNPAEERARYDHNTDQLMTVLRFVDANDKDLGMINWFPVHPTNMNNTNTLISSDNKGYASIMFEADMNPGSFPGQGPFVAAFGQSNLGDVSPNTKGARCIDTGFHCDMIENTCGDGKVQNCIAFGPGDDMFESTRIIGHNQYAKAKELYHQPGVKLEGPVDFRMRYEDMTDYEVDLGTEKVRTCKPAMGYSFAAGTSDGPGAFNFKQGDVDGNLFWNLVRNVIKKPSKELVDCHKPKPILLPTGEINYPYPWHPAIMDYQVFRIGQFIMLGVPGEFSTMAGRRTRETIVKNLKAQGYPADTTAVVAGLSNSYSHYIVTYEEYLTQRYEGASTIYGPHTLSASMQILNGLADAMAQGKSVEKGTAPPNLKDVQLSLKPPVIYDQTPFGKQFGGMVTKPQSSYQPGQTATAVFHAGNPRNSNARHTRFMAVEQLQRDYTWKVVYLDSHWETKFHWERVSTVKGTSHAHVSWDIPQDQNEGTYRFVHMGHAKRAIGNVRPYTGYSPVFQVSRA